MLLSFWLAASVSASNSVSARLRVSLTTASLAQSWAVFARLSLTSSVSVRLSVSSSVSVRLSVSSFVSSEPPLDRHMPVFTGNFFPSTGENYSRRYQVPAEIERFVWLARDHTLYPGSWSKWKLPLNRITSGDVQQAKQWTQKLSLPLATKLSLITVCKGWVVSTRSTVLPTSALKNVRVVTRKLDLDQTSVAPTHAEKHW